MKVRIIRTVRNMDIHEIACIAIFTLSKLAIINDPTKPEFEIPNGVPEDIEVMATVAGIYLGEIKE